MRVGERREWGEGERRERHVGENECQRKTRRVRGKQEREEESG